MKKQDKIKIIFLIVCVLILFGLIKLFDSSFDAQSRENWTIFKEQFNADKVVFETDDVKIIENSDLVSAETMIKEYIIIQRNPFIVRERENSILFQSGGKTSIVILDYLRTDYKYHKDRLEVIDVDEHAATGGFDHISWFTEKSFVPTFSVVQIRFEGRVDEMEEFEIKYVVDQQEVLREGKLGMRF